MSSIALSQEQITLLHQFCQKHGVKHYEVQMELVDHLATAIESQMRDNFTISFEAVLDAVYKSFGVTGFRKLVVAKEQQAEKQANKVFWRNLKTFFRLPHIVLTLLLIILFAFIYYNFADNKILLTQIVAVIATLLIIAEIIILRQFLKAKKQALQPMLLLSFLPGYWILSLPCYLLSAYPIRFLLDSAPNYIHTLVQYAYISTVCIFYILSLLALRMAFRDMKLKARHFYPANFS